MHFTYFLNTFYHFSFKDALGGKGNDTIKFIV